MKKGCDESKEKNGYHVILKMAFYKLYQKTGLNDFDKLWQADSTQNERLNS